MKRMKCILIDYNEIYEDRSQDQDMRQIKRFKVFHGPLPSIPSNQAHDWDNLDSPGSTQEIAFASS